MSSADSATITLSRSGRQFSAAAGATLLGAAQQAGLILPYSCGTGRCSSCKGRVLSGHTEALQQETGLDPAEREAGWVLCCVRQAVGEVSLDIEDLTGLNTPPAQTLPCRIQALERLSHDVLRVTLRLPPNKVLDFLPGQYVEVIGEGGLRRAYSLASAPRADHVLELHIRQVDGGAMSQYWFEGAKVNDLLRLHGPLGTFFLRDAAGLDLVLMATGTGIAPIRALLQGLGASLAGGAPAPRSITVLWGGRRPDDIYCQPLDGIQGLPEVRYIPVLSRAGADWTGARGYIQQSLMDTGLALGGAQVYACGSDTMIRDAHRQLVAAGLSERQFHSDAFVPSAKA